MKFVYEGCSIECESAEIISRQIQRSSFMEINAIGKCTTYKCKRNSEATITKELLAPKIPFHNNISNVNLNDKLECQDLFFAINNKSSIKIKIINYTHTHKAQTTTTNCYTYAEISRQFPNIPEPRTALIET